MLLLIPSIEIKDGQCVQMVKGSDGVFRRLAPVEMAKLWRTENAKSLHITDVDGALAGHPVNLRMVRELTKAIDIPIELGGGLRTMNDIHEAFNSGVYRVIIGTMLLEEPQLAMRAIEHYSASKISIGIDAENGIAKIKGRTVDSGLTAVSVGLNAKQLGFRRVMYHDIVQENTREVKNFTAMKTFAETTGMRVTASGEIAHLQDLLQLQELERFGLDSVIVGRALYENNFSCQQLWRMCEADHYPYTAKV